MSTALTLAPAMELFVDPRPFALAHDEALPSLALTYELRGPTAATHASSSIVPAAPMVIVQGGISADAHVTATADDPRPGWWSEIVGDGKAIDTRRFRVLSLDYVGRREAATVTSSDQARATALLLDALGIDRVHAFVGASYGGMVGLAFASLFSERIDRLVAISAPDRSRVFATAWRALQRRVLRLGARAGADAEALVLARALGMLSYRSAREFEERFASEPERDGEALVFPVERYLDARGRDFAARFDSGALSRLSLAIDLHQVDVGSIRCATTLVAADPDLLVPPEQLEELAPCFGRPARCVRLPSLFGHDAFLKESARLAPILVDALEESP